MPDVISLGVFGGLVILAVYLVYFYASKRTSLAAKGLTLLGWLIGLLIVALLPLDISALLHHSNPKVGSGRGGKDAEDTANVALYWKLLYWTAFFLCYGVLPVMVAYLDNGHFTFKAKMWYAVKFNLIIIGILAIVGVVCLVLLLLISDQAFR